MRMVILGVGNVLLTDEGIGVAAVTTLEDQFDLPAEIEIIDGGTSGMDCLDRLAEADILVIADAMRSKKQPGTITRLEGEQISAFFKTKISPHQVGLSDVLATLALHGLSPKKVVLIGVEPFSFATCMDLSEQMKPILPQVVAMLAAEIEAAGLAVRRKAA